MLHDTTTLPPLLLHLSDSQAKTEALSKLLDGQKLIQWKGPEEDADVLHSTNKLLFIIDAHSDFRTISHFFANSLPQLGEASLNWNAAILFVSDTWDTPTPPLDSTGDQSNASSQKPKQSILKLRKNQFFIRMVTSYGWGAFCHVSRVKNYLTRIANSRSAASPLSLNASEVLAWKGDIDRIWEVIDEKRQRGPWIEMPAEYFRKHTPRANVFPGLKRETVLECLAIVHQFGRVDQAESEASMSSSKIDWMKSRPPLPPRCREWINSRTLSAMKLYIPELRQLDPSIIRFIKSEVKAQQSPQSAVNSALVMNAGSRNLWRAKQVLFDLLTDMSQILAKGCAPWAVRSLSRPASETGQPLQATPLRVLAIKDYVRDSIERSRLEESFSHAFYAAFRRGTVELHCVEYRQDASSAKQNVEWDTHEWWLKHLNTNAHVTTVLHPTDTLVGARVGHDSDGGAPLSYRVPHTSTFSLTDYDIILIEAEFETRFVGSSIIQWLDNALDEMRQAERNAQSKRRPQIFVLSRDENAGHSFMCLWLGAQAFASKSRIHSIPSLLSMANVGIWATTPDSKKRRPNFFAIEGLLPHQRNRLQSRRPEHLVIGDEWDRHWIRGLPKADLHFHMGTSISLDAIGAMAANTCGRVIADSDATTESDGPICELVRNVCKIVLLANLDWKRHSDGMRKSAEAYEELWAVARFVLLPTDVAGEIVPNVAPAFGAMEQAIRWLTRSDRPVREFEACSVLVTALRVFEIYIANQPHPPGVPQFNEAQVESSFMASVRKAWSGPALLSALLENEISAASFETASGKDNGGAKGLAGELCSTLAYLVARIGQNWSDLFTSATLVQPPQGTPTQNSAVDYLSVAAKQAVANAEIAFTRIAQEFDRLVSSDSANKTWIHDALQRFRSRKAEFVYPADEKMINVFEHDPINTVQKLKECISLRELVVVPTTRLDSEGRDATTNKDSGVTSRTLARYLVGSGLLGAEHLQFPENIILAGMDVVRQNVNDNVVYSEVRCATTGYCEAGMNVFDATDLLCTSFDLGALLFGGWSPEERQAIAREKQVPSEIALDWVAPPHRWVRANILLGAKRHKSKEISQVVNLVTGYLRRGPEVPAFRSNFGERLSHDIPGQWWQRCAVVGFDLSGDESRKIDDLQKQVEPLFDACASITIHAGEAMSAHSIWDAVHHLGAQRIGHGLRLRENEKLLEHCVRRGICLELCPISNSFTNVFSCAPIEYCRSCGCGEIDRGVASSRRHEYPINAFVRAGLDVCLNTDNRSLHETGTLTDEYLQASRLSGGLSRWDILRLCKAAFKNAFVPKDQIASLLRHVEYEIYKIACEHSGENAFPSVEGFRRPAGS